MTSELGALIKGQRELLGLTQKQVAFRCGLHSTVISDIERGKRIPKRTAPDRLIALAQVLDLDPVRVQELAGVLPRSDVKEIRKRPSLEEFITTERSLAAPDRFLLLEILKKLRAGSQAVNDGQGSFHS